MNFARPIAGAPTPQFQQAAPVIDASKEASYQQGSWEAQQDIADASRASNLDHLMNATGSFVSAFSKGVAEKKASSRLSSLGGLEEDLAKAAEVGATDPSYNVEKKQREIRAKYAAANPDMVGEINKAYKSTTGRNAAEITREQFQYREQVSAATKNGYVMTGMTEDEIQKGVSLYETSLNQEAQVARLKANNQLSKDRLLNVELPDMIATSNQAVSNKADTILRNVSAGNMSVADSKIAFGRMRIELNQAVTALGPLANDPDVEFLFQPTRDSIKLYEDLATGKIDDETAKEQISAINNRQQLIFLSDPKRARLATSSKMLGESVTSLLVQDPTAVKIMGEYYTGKIDPTNPNETLEQATTRDYATRYENPFGSETGQPNAGEAPKNKPSKSTSVDPRELNASTRTGVQKSVTEGMKSDQSGQAFKEATLFIDDALTHALRNGEDYNASDWGKMFNTIPQSKELNSLLPPEVQIKYEEAFRRYSVDQMPRVINETLNNNVITQTDTYSNLYGRPTSTASLNANILDTADVVVSDGGIMLKPKPEYASNSAVRNELRTVNSRLTSEIVPVYKAMAKYHGESLSNVLNSMVVPMIAGKTEASQGASQEPSEASPEKEPTAQEEFNSLAGSIAEQVGVDPKLMESMAKAESGFDSEAQASTSSAGGYFQFIDKTWDSMVDKYGEELGVAKGTPKTDKEANIKMGAQLIKENQESLGKTLGRSATNGESYLAHFLGLKGATNFIKASDDTPVEEVATADQIEANASILKGKTVGQVKAWAEEKMK